MWRIILGVSLVSSLSAGELELFHIDPQAIRKVALEALQDKHPDISIEDLDQEHPYRYLMINCTTGQQNSPTDLAFIDPSSCIAQIDFQISPTIIQERYVDENGNCMVLEHSETVSVVIYYDGKTSVGGRGSRSSNYSVECTDDFEITID